MDDVTPSDAAAIESIRKRLAEKRRPEGMWNGTPHLIWTGHIEEKGYGTMKDGRVKKPRKVHRLAWELEVGPIPEGYEIDHLCKVKACSQTDGHIEPVTPWVNKDRSGAWDVERNKTHCPQGHLYDEANTRWSPSGKKRACRACNRDRARAWRRNAAAERAAARKVAA